MAEREHHVIYRAIADFSSLYSEARKARTELAKLKAEEASIGAVSSSAESQATSSRQRASKSASDAAKSVKDYSTATKESTQSSKSAAKASDDLFTSVESTTKSFSNRTSTLERDTQALSDSDKATKDLSASSTTLQALLTDLSSIFEKRARANRVLVDSNGQIIDSNKKQEQSSSESGRAVSAMTAELSKLSESAKRAAKDVDGLERSNSRMGGGGKGKSTFSQLSDGAEKAFASLSKLGASLTRISVLGALGGLIAPALTALGTLIPLALAAANALGSLGASAAAIGPGLFTLATGAGALLVAFSGVGAAFKAYQKSVTAATAAGESSSQAQVDQARRVQDAQRSLEDARIQQARSAVDSARRIEDAERSLARSQRETQKAQENLNEARKQALEDLIALREEVQRGSLDEEGARARLLKAQEDYQKSLADPNQTAADRANALYDLHKAEQDLKDVQEKRAEDTKKLAVEEKKGVEGSDKVVEAKDRLTTAELAQQDAVRSLARAQEDSARAQFDNARAVQRALENLKRAKEKDAAGSTAAERAANLYKAALARLSPSARKVVEGVIAMRDAWTKLQKDVQESFFKHLVGDLERVKGELPVVSRLLTDAGDALGTVADKGVKMVTSGPWTSDFYTLSKANRDIIASLGDAALDVADAFRNITVAAIPLATGIADDIKKLAHNFKEFIDNARQSGDLGRFFKKAQDRLEQFGRIVGNLASTFTDLTLASTGFTDWLIASIERVSNRWKDLARSQKQANSPLKKFLENVKPLLSQIYTFLAQIGDAFLNLISDPKSIQVATDLLKQLGEEVLPAIVDALKAMRDSGLTSAVLSAFTDILHALADVLNSGAGTGLIAFVNTLGALATIIGAIVKIPGVGPILGAVAAALGTIAALSFAAKFSGLATLAKIIKGISKQEGPISRVLGMLTGGAIGGSGGGKGGGGKGGRSGGKNLTTIIDRSLGRDTTSEKGKRQARKQKEKQTRSGGGSLGDAIDQSLGRGDSIDAIIAQSNKDVAKTKPRRLPRFKGPKGRLGALLGLGSLLGKGGAGKALAGGARGLGGALAKGGKFLGKGLGGPLGILASIAGGAIADQISDGKGGLRDIGGGALSGAISGAGIGGLIGSVVPVIGTTIGAGVGGAIGGVLGAVDGAGGLDKFLSKMGDLLKGFGPVWDDFTSMLSSGWDTVTGAASDAWDAIEGFFSDGWDSVSSITSDGWNSVKDFFTTGWTDIQTFVQSQWTLLENTFTTAWTVLEGIVTGGWTAIQNAFTTAWTILSASVTGGWNQIRTFFSQGATAIQNAVSGAWTGIQRAFSNGWTVLETLASQGWAQIKTIFSSAGSGLVSAVTGTMDSLRTVWGRITTDLAGPVEFFVNTIIGSDVIGPVNQVLDFLHLPKIPVPHVAFAAGGRVGGTGNRDTVPAMLTPGEFVVRKQVVSQVGIGFMEDLNSGKKTSSLKARRRDGAGSQIPGHYGHGGLALNSQGFLPGSFGTRGRTGSPQSPLTQMFTLGGLVGSLSDLVRSVGNAGESLLGKAGNFLSQITRLGASGALSVATKPLKALLDSLGTTGLPGLFRAEGNYALDQILSYVSGQESGSAPGGVGGVKKAPANVSGNKALVRDLAASLYHWVGVQWDALYNLVMGESGFNNNAANPTSTAYGLFQFLDSTWGTVGAKKTSDPRQQTIAGLKYISKVYGNPANAYGKWRSRSPHWYGSGGPVDPRKKTQMRPKAQNYGPKLAAYQFGGMVSPPGSPSFSVPSRALNEAAASISTVNRGFNVEKIEVNNPRVEKAGESLYRTVERLTFFGGSRG